MILKNTSASAKNTMFLNCWQAITKKDLSRAIQIINYFESNPKAVPIQMALPALYAFFSKVYAVYGMNDKSDNALKPFFYYNPIHCGRHTI